MKGKGVANDNERDVIISGRIRLARNFHDYPFPFKMNGEQGRKVMERVKDAIFKSNASAPRNFIFLEIPGMSPADRQVLVERHLISPDLAAKNSACGVILSKDERISILINEEDHLRIQCIYPGFNLEHAWQECRRMDLLLEEKIEFAFDPGFGYLTCCPTNVGTGMRASFMLHLPALVMTGYIKSILEACSKLGVAVRGIYGENTEALGNMFQISNQVTLGQSEEEILASITNIAQQIIAQERNLRQELYKQSTHRLEDKIFRSYGLFTNARIMASEEGLKLLSDVRLGVDMGIIKDIELAKLDELMILMQPASLQKAAGMQLGAEERDIKRAELIRSMLKGE